MGNEKRHLLEAGAFAESKPADDGTWKVRIINEGRGSSGIYTASLLENYGHAFDNALSFKNHPAEWDGPTSRDFTMITGQIVGSTWIEKDERGLTALYGNYLPDPDYREKLERYKGKLGLSIYIGGDGHVDENGDFVVDTFDEHDPYSSVDVVLAAGRGGKFEESLKDFYATRVEKASAASAEEKTEKKGLHMEKDVEERFDALTNLVQGLIDSKQAEAQAEADASAVEAEVEKRVEAISASVDAVEAARADLLKAQVAPLLESAKRGEDVAQAIEDAKAIAKEARAELAEGKAEQRQETGRLGESATEYTLKGFGGK